MRIYYIIQPPTLSFRVKPRVSDHVLFLYLYFSSTVIHKYIIIICNITLSLEWKMKRVARARLFFTWCHVCSRAIVALALCVYLHTILYTIFILYCFFPPRCRGVSRVYTYKIRYKSITGRARESTG